MGRHPGDVKMIASVVFVVLIILALYAGWLNVRIYGQIKRDKAITFLLYLWLFEPSKLSAEGREIRRRYLITFGLVCVVFVAFLNV